MILLGLGFLRFSRIKNGAFLIFSILPLIAGWLLGFRPGILYWIFHCLLLSFLAKMAGQVCIDFFPMGFISYTFTLIFAAGMGKMSDLRKRLHHELKERKRFEKELQHYKEKLEKLVEDCTEELFEEQ